MTFGDALRWVVNAAAYFVVTVGLGGVFMLYTYQNNLIYPANFPAGSREVVDTPDKVGLHDFENLTITTPDKVKIKAYFIRRRKASGDNSAQSADGEGLRNRAEKKAGELADTTVIYCHANAGNMGHRLPIARILHEKFKSNVLMFSYRGYGTSEGTPSETGLKIDAQAALEWVLANPELPPNSKIIVYGQSIGGAVAINLAATNKDKVSALIVENTFLTLPKIVPAVIPAAKYLTFLCHQIWDSETAIQTIPSKMPILLLSGGNDELIPPTHMAQLCNVARGARRKSVSSAPSVHDGTKLSKEENGVVFVLFPNGTHNETCVQRGYFDEMLQFVENYVLGRGKTVGGDSVETIPSAKTKASGIDGVKNYINVVKEGGAGAEL
ncbi:Alpha/Beta hydrolase protein [Fimicolochytrium jonesii]|uniref:Alpha/Beta hydrolase protein n=1 Tax=Fimicolochytrium jonesii TaxID=1396493 RepID=UPI0022FE6F67|nr:Alpha/Beta hydrolase protein [Fimicolochytrium jonesii]KAI8827132.1 Alpha/Beta hydrolase protein [Fimicolochytrium jonesii]